MGKHGADYCYGISTYLSYVISLSQYLYWRTIKKSLKMQSNKSLKHGTPPVGAAEFNRYMLQEYFD